MIYAGYGNISAWKYFRRYCFLFVNSFVAFNSFHILCSRCVSLRLLSSIQDTQIHMHIFIVRWHLMSFEGCATCLHRPSLTLSLSFSSFFGALFRYQLFHSLEILSASPRAHICHTDTHLHTHTHTHSLTHTHRFHTRSGSQAASVPLE